MSRFSKGDHIQLYYLQVIEGDVELEGYIIQGSVKPSFDCESRSGAKWICGCCRERVLVANADPQILFGIRIQCNKCRSVNETPYALGESQPAGGFCFNRGKNYLFKDTIFPKGVPIMSEAFVDACRAHTPSAPTSKEVILPFTLLDTVERFASRSGQRVSKLLQSIQRAPAHMGDQIHPLLAAYSRINKAMAGDFRLHGSDLEELFIFHEFYTRWEHHPRSKVIIDGICNEYDHTIVLLFVASYLAENGFGITFNLSTQHGRSITDLYTRLALHEIIHFEVKVPNSRAGYNVRGEIGHLVQIAWKKVRAKGQISRTATGFIVVGRVGVADSRFEELNMEVDSFLRRRGRENRHVEGVLAVELPVRGVLAADENGGISVQQIASPRFHSNPFFAGRRRVTFTEYINNVSISNPNAIDSR